MKKQNKTNVDCYAECIFGSYAIQLSLQEIVFGSQNQTVNHRANSGTNHLDIKVISQVNKCTHIM